MQVKPPVEIEDIELIALDERAGASPDRPWYDPGEIAGRISSQRWFFLSVVLPSLLAALYFGLIAADRYESESRFVVRSPAASGSNPLSGLMQGGSILRSADDAYIVHAYMSSRDALRVLVKEVGLLARLERPEADFLWRYPGPFLSHNEERLYDHFENFVSIDFDQSTGISTLKVQGFRPEDAQEIAEVLLKSSEDLINRLSERAQGDAIRTAAREVEEARARAREALDLITAFRRKNALIDPGRVSTAALETITTLALEVAQTNAQLAELSKASPDSPQAASLRLRIDALEAQMKQEREALAGADTSLAPLIAEYERLSLEREFAERTFASAQTALDLARIDAQRQRLFLERISSPALADYPKYPERLLGILAVLAVSFILFTIAHRFASDTRSHSGN